MVLQAPPELPQEQIALVSDGPAALVPLAGLRQDGNFLAEQSAVVRVDSVWDMLTAAPAPVVSALCASCIAWPRGGRPRILVVLS